MTNIWADSFKEIRKPFFNIQDPYTLSEEKEKEEKGEKKHKEGKEKSEKAGEDQEHKYTNKSGKKSKDYDDDGEVEDETDEYAGVRDRAIKKAMKMEEERELQSRSKKGKKLDVRSGINNQIDTKPSIPEEVQLWVEELLEEGYDLSEYTWEDMYRFYLDEANSAVAPAGDAETQTIDSSAKKRTAQMQIRKELADVQLAKAKAQSGQTNESVIAYLENRYNIFG